MGIRKNHELLLLLPHGRIILLASNNAEKEQHKDGKSHCIEYDIIVRLLQ
jgi:hypothetical protein